MRFSRWTESRFRQSAAMIESLKQTKDKPVSWWFGGPGKQLSFTVQPKLADDDGTQEQRYRIGIGSVPTKIGRLPFIEAVSRSIEENKRTSLLILELVQKHGARQISLRTMEGPIGIGRAAGQLPARKAGLRSWG